MERNTRLEQYFVVAALAVLLIWISYGVLAPIILGLLMALVLFPVHQWLCTRAKFPQTFSALFITLGLTIGVVLPLTYIGTIVAKDLLGFVQSFQPDSSTLNTGSAPNSEVSKLGFFADSLQSVFLKFQTWISEKGFDRFFPQGAEGLQSGFNWVLTNLASGLAPVLGSLVKSAPKLLLEIGFFLIALFYGFLDGPRLARFFTTLLPFKTGDLDNFRITTQQISRGVVLGSLITGFFQGLVLGLGYYFFDIPRPFFFGVLTLVFSLIPFLGSAPAGIGGIIYLVAQSQWGSALGMGIFYLVATLSDNVIKPWVLKGSGELHPLLALISVLGGLSVFGFTGIFLGPLVAALAVSALRILSRAP